MVRPGSEVEVGHSQRMFRATSQLQGRMHTIDAKYLEIQLTKNIDLFSITNDFRYLFHHQSQEIGGLCTYRHACITMCLAH